MDIKTGTEDWVDVSPTLFNEDFIKDPYPVYEKMRSLGRVLRIADSEGQTWVFTHYDDVADILKDTKRFSARRTMELLKMVPLNHRDEFNYLKEWLDMTVAYNDGDMHKRARSVMVQGLETYDKDRLKSEIQESVDMLIDKIKDKEELDYVEEFAKPLPSLVILKRLGIPSDELDKYIKRAAVVISFISNSATADFTKRGSDAFYSAALKVQDQLKVIMGDFLTKIEEKRKDPKEDTISYMVAARSEDGEPLLTDMQLAVQCCLLSFNGIETTRSLISSAAMLLLKHKEEKSKLEHDPELIDAVIEEALRCETPAQSIRRTALEDMDYQGAPVRKGDSILLFLGAANRDPAYYEDPNTFDVTRDHKKNLAFGYGPHFCVGAELSRLEARASISTLFKRLPNLELKKGEDALVWEKTPVFRGLEKLDLTL
jgi:cytochrome P450